MEGENFMMMKMNLMNLSISSPSPVRNKDQGSKESSIDLSRQGSRANSMSKSTNVDTIVLNDPETPIVTNKPFNLPMTPPKTPNTPTPDTNTSPAPIPTPAPVTFGSGAGGAIFRPTRKRNGS